MAKLGFKRVHSDPRWIMLCSTDDPDYDPVITERERKWLQDTKERIAARILNEAFGGDRRGTDS